MGKEGFTRRDVVLGLVGGTVTAATFDPKTIFAAPDEVETTPNPELDTATDHYGFVFLSPKAYREPSEDSPVLGTYHSRALLRYRPFNETFVKIAHDEPEFNSHPQWKFAHGDIFLPRRYVAELPEEDVTPFPLETPDETREIRVDLTKQQISVYTNGEKVRDDIFVSTGKNGHETPTGTFYVQHKLWADEMQGSDARDGNYDLPGVPFVQYIHGAVAIHGAYWHADFGKERVSHGCINVPIHLAKWLYQYTTPAHGSFNKPSVIGDSTSTKIVVGY